MSHADRLRLVDADFEEIGDQRRSDRRRTDRRAQRLRLDTRFAATLINQIAKPETPRAHYGPAARAVRAGIAFDVKA